ncbi:winged helix-turn-helix transcriptional regulator [Sedimentibacter sp. zth1]|uniref:ArsR/SmtB family transcription factor n=1 Tax=Sedimentibacter sp. zth1 TaxID=2816908 RepID=UPI001A935F7F|nr:metalloregulator ArsR/SmtB family transcription factor [Sedimentibacter sp. zth1]QSX06287.1 winged helix-turn-helix transcriptional regulator [Sedimentibacter sp. zth1]
MIDFSNKEKIKGILTEKAEIFKTIGHPVRLCILTMLIMEQKSNVSDMQFCLDVPQPLVSQHLAKLKSAGIISSERKGTEIIYKIKNEEVKHIVEQILE